MPHCLLQILVTSLTAQSLQKSDGLFQNIQTILSEDNQNIRSWSHIHLWFNIVRHLRAKYCICLVPYSRPNKAEANL